jgi:hypothetical protein
LLAAIGGGGVFTVVDGIATPGYLDFKAEGVGGSTGMGGVLPPGPGRVTVRASMPRGGTLVLLHEGDELATTSGPELSTTLAPMSGAFRVEVRAPRAPGSPPVPWLVSNPIYFLPPVSMSAGASPVAVGRPLPAATVWHVEKDAGSTARVDGTGASGELEYRLRPGARVSQFVAMVADLVGAGPFDGVVFDARASRPMRVSVQLRYPGDGGGRWVRSAYVDGSTRSLDVAVEHLLPADRQSTPQPDRTTARSLLFVVDLTNAAPGDSGLLHLSNIRLR